MTIKRTCTLHYACELASIDIEPNGDMLLESKVDVEGVTKEALQELKDMLEEILNND